jgi:hypothetical protein
LGPEHPYIETIPRQGYRFSALVKERREEIPPLIVREHTRSTVTIEEETDAARETPSLPQIQAPDAVVELPKPRHSIALWAAGVVVGVAALAATTYSLRHTTNPRLPERPTETLAIPSLAQGKYLTVLPFRALGDQPSLD